MFAPRLVPPCLIASVAASKTRRNETGPDATPIVERTRSPFGRRREKAKPVPPPDWWMTAVSLIAPKMPGMLSGTGSTKQAESCWISRPAFIRVGELGRKSRSCMIARNFGSHSATAAPLSTFWPLNRPSACAMLRATRRNNSSGVSLGWPASSLAR